MKKNSVWILLILTFLIAIILNMAHPVTPKLISELKLPSVMFGIFFAAMSLGNFFFSPIWGGLSDTKGRIKFLVIGLFGYGVSQLGFGFVTNPILIVFFRILGGAFVTSYLTVSLAYLSDITNNQNRVKYMSYYAGASTFGGSLGSLLGGVIGDVNYKTTFIWQFILAMIFCVIIVLVLKETLNHKKERAPIKLTNFSLNTYKELLNRNLIIIMILVTMFYFSGTSYSSSINYYIETILNYSPKFIGVFLSVAGVIGFFANIIITPYLGKKIDSKVSFKYINLFMGISLLSAALIPSVLLFFIFVILFVAISSIYVPVQQNIVIKLAKENYGTLMGLQNSAKAAGMVIGSLFAGAVFDYNSKLPFLAAGSILILSFIILSKLNYEIE